MSPEKIEKIFSTPYDQYKDRKDQVCEVLGRVDINTYDYPDCGPMYNIRFKDGTEIEAWPEELFNG